MFVLLFIFLLTWNPSSTLNYFNTRSVLEDISGPFSERVIIKIDDDGNVISGRSGGECYGDIPLKSEQPTDFLDMVNFMEFVQATTAGTPRSEEFMNYYHLATASMDHGNTYMAQEHMARALRAVESRDQIKWDAKTLFEKFRETMGDQKFKELLHLDRRVLMAFVIDTSSSMANDITQVKQYIRQLVNEQEKAGVSAQYSVTTFADPDVFGPEVFQTKENLMRKLESLTPSIGGDCEEKTCDGIMKAIHNSEFYTTRNSAMYVFTDASSKGCGNMVENIIRLLAYLKASAFFILFGSCKPNIIDNHFVTIGQRSGGFTLLIQENGIYNITDTVNGAFDKDTLVCGENSDDTRSIIGQQQDGFRMKRDVEQIEEEFEERSILIDTSIERFKVIISASPVSVLKKVRLERPIDGDAQLCGTLHNGRENVEQLISSADNSVVIDVSTLSCPCTGKWTLRYPRDIITFDYQVRSSGQYLVDFEVYFVDTIESSDIANYSPCLGIRENLVIKLNQGEKVNRDSLIATLVGLAGNVIYWKGKLEKVDRGNNAFVVPLIIPNNIGTDGFRILLEGELVDGTKFQRSSSNHFYPSGSCLRTTYVSKYYALVSNKVTFIKLTVSNYNNYEELYQLTCSNSGNYDINVGPISTIKSPGKADRHGKSNPVLLTEAESATFNVKVAAPGRNKIIRGRTVTVTCKVTSSTADLIEMIMLTEMDTDL